MGKFNNLTGLFVDFEAETIPTDAAVEPNPRSLPDCCMVDDCVRSYDTASPDLNIRANNSAYPDLDARKNSGFGVNMLRLEGNGGGAIQWGQKGRHE